MKTSTKIFSSYELFNSVKKFSVLSPWKWLTSRDIFGVKLPELEEEVFCCVLGNGGQEFGLVMQKGLKGLNNIIKILYASEEEKEVLFFEQTGLALYLNDRDEITKEDYALIKDSKVKFRGRKKWPSFRKFSAGVVPVIPDDEDLSIIQQILDVALSLTVDLKKYIEDEEWSFLSNNICVVRVVDSDNNYEDRIIEIHDRIANYKETIDIPVAYADFSLLRLKKSAKLIDTIWEIDFFHYSLAVKENEQAFYPISLLLVDAYSQRVVGQHIVHPSKYAEEFQKYILTMIDNTKQIPARIVTSNRKLYFYLDEMFDKLGVRFDLVEQLHLMPHLKIEIQNMLQS